MWSSNTEGLQRNSSSSDTATTGDSSPMELSLNQSLEGLTIGVASLTGSDMLGGSAYAHSLGDSNGVNLTGSQVVEEMDLATSTDEDFENWVNPPDLFQGCQIYPTTSLRIGKEVGNGAFSTIYLGQHTNELGQVEMVAVKRVDFQKKPSSGKKAFPPQIMFHREIAFLKSLRQFRHPNIIRLVGACQVPPLIVTEFVSGGSLYARLHESTQELTLPHRLFIAFGISNGMSLLHEKGIIHRDLTSENVLLTSQDEPRIIDFGFAVQKFPNVEGQTFVLRPAGNARWRAPEITLRQPYNRTVDVYSYGIILNEILSRQVPFHHIERSRDAAAAASQGSRPAIGTDDKELLSLVTRCWAGDPAQRPSFEVINKALQTELLRRFQ